MKQASEKAPGNPNMLYMISFGCGHALSTLNQTIEWKQTVYIQLFQQIMSSVDVNCLLLS